MKPAGLNDLNITTKDGLYTKESMNMTRNDIFGHTSNHEISKLIPTHFLKEPD